MTTSSPTPQDQYLEAVRQGQDALVKATQLWSDNMQRMLTGASSAAGLAATPEQISAAGQAATPEQIIDNVFGFAEQLLAVQRDFAKRLLQAASPAVDAAQSTAQPTTKEATSTKKATSRS
jgi:hypothetical protein